LLDRHSASLVRVVISLIFEIVVKQVILLAITSLNVLISQASARPSTFLLASVIEFEIT